MNIRHPFSKDKLTIRWYRQAPLVPFKDKVNDATPVLEEGCEIITALGHDPYIASGTLLGAIRENDYIPHDTDLDVNILVEKHDKVLTQKGLIEFVTVFQKKGFELVRIMLYSGTLMQLVFAKDEVTFDIEFIHKDLQHDWYITVHEHGVYFYDKKFYMDKGYTKFKGSKYITPHPVKAYLDHRYGEWKKPATKKGAWQDDANNFVSWS